MMDIIMWIIVGALAGWVASKIMKTDAQMGAMANIIVGILGALIGGWIVRMLLGTSVDPNGFNLWSILTAILGSVVLIWIIKLVRGQR